MKALSLVSKQSTSSSLPLQGQATENMLSLLFWKMILNPWSFGKNMVLIVKEPISVEPLICLQLVGLLAGEKSSDQADFQDHTMKYLSKGYDTFKVSKIYY